MAAQGQSASSSRLPIALHFPTAALPISTSTLNERSRGSNATSSSNPRRSPVPPPGGLPTLPEASHANALHLAGSSASAEGTDNVFDAASDPALSGLTPPQRALAAARAQDYDGIVVELGNALWKERWERLCLSPLPEAATPGGIQGPNGNGRLAAGAPQQGHTGVGGSWEIIHGAQGIARSSSRVALNATASAKSNGASFVRPSKADLTAREAEEWRRAPAFRRSEMNVTKLEEVDGLLALASPWLELDSPDEGIRLDSEIALHQELAYASYLGISHVVLPPPSSDPARRQFLPDYARAVNGALVSGGAEGAPAGQWMTLSIRIPISSPHGLDQTLARQANRGANGLTASNTASTTASSTSAGSSSTAAGGGGGGAAGAAYLRADDDWAWETWETIRQLCAHNTRLQIGLDLSYPLPGPVTLARWVAEPVGQLWLPATAYLANAKGFPVLSKAAQGFIRSMLRRAPTVVLSGINNPPPMHARGGAQAYIQYVRHLERTAPPEDAVDQFARGYNDWLQAPLQPLMDNLEGATYEVFERDPVKYAQYEEAVHAALCDRPAGSTTSIWVCGAGRGPLVARCLRAAERAGRAVKLVALEKNPNALVTLQERQALEWGDAVRVLFGDMRTTQPPALAADRADIVVSELLGSFGDNELSPECLDGAMRFLKPNGISIPSSYTTYITPLSSSKLHSEVLNSSTANQNGVQKAAETPYVVLFQAVAYLATQGGRGNWAHVQECWSFEHRSTDVSPTLCDANGLPLTNQHNVRTTQHTFHIPQAGVCHGFAGYFEAVLYGDLTISIHPDPARGSKDMLSWFPIFFPLKDPLYLPANSELDVHMWRLTGSRKVWYEWCAEVFLPLASGSMASSTTGSTDTHLPSVSANTSVPPTPATPQSAHMGDAFQHAPGTPRAPSVSLPGGASAPEQNQAAPGAMGPPPVPAHKQVSVNRIKTGMTGLLNQGGRSSWIGL